jgi:hypothetical protein
MRTDEASRCAGPTLPWWRVPTLWLVVGGPAVVVVAGIATAVVAARGADTVLTRPAAAASDAPALQARNHAATPRADDADR